MYGARADQEDRVFKYTWRSDDRKQEPGEAGGADNIKHVEYKEFRKQGTTIE